MGKLNVVLLLCCWVGVASGASGDIATTGSAKRDGGKVVEIKFPLQHSLGLGQPFVEAGTFTARANFDKAGTGAVRLSHIKLARRDFTDEETAQFKQLVANDDLYRIQLPASVVTVTEEDSRSVMTWLPARCLVDSGLQESFVLHMDETGHIISLEYGQPGGGCRTRGDGDTEAPPSLKFRSSCSAKFAKDAPRLAYGPVRVTPDFADDPAFAEKDGAEPDDPNAKPQGIMQKYWYIIVPMMLTNLFTAFAKEEPAKGGGGRAVEGAKQGGGGGGGGAKKE